MKNRCAGIILSGVLVIAATRAGALGLLRVPILPALSMQLDGLNTRSGEPSAENAPKSATIVHGAAASSSIGKLDSGVVLVAELSKSLNAKKLHPGDKVTARVTQALIVKGKIVIPRGSKLIGNVTEIKTRSKEDPESRLGIVFAKAKGKNGEFSLDAIVQALGQARRFAVDKPDPMLPPQMGPNNTNTAPQPIGANRVNATGGQRDRSLPRSPNLSTSLSPSTSAGAIPNPKPGGLQENGMLSSGSRGVFGLPGLTLKFTGTAQIPVITSIRQDVKLESGVQLVLKVVH